MTHEVNVLALVKGAERFVFVYDDASRDTLLETFRAEAANPHSRFNWFDAAVLTERARTQVETVVSEE